jgi:hypothetical protein
MIGLEIQFPELEYIAAKQLLAVLEPCFQFRY